MISIRLFTRQPSAGFRTRWVLEKIIRSGTASRTFPRVTRYGVGACLTRHMVPPNGTGGSPAPPVAGALHNKRWGFRKRPSQHYQEL